MSVSAPTLSDIAREVGVSVSTASRALRRPELVRPDVAERVRATASRLGYRTGREGGGRSPRLPGERTFAERRNEHTPEKLAIARRACALVPPGGVVGVDSGSTGVELALMLPRLAPLTIVTSALAIAEALPSTDEVELMLCGGMLDHHSHSLVGPVAEETIARVSLDVAFLTGRSLSAEKGLMNMRLETVAVKRALAAAASTVVALVESAKVQREGIVTILAPREVDVLVTDSGVGEDDVRRLESAGVQVLVALGEDG